MSNRIGFSALEGLTDFLWTGGMCESRTVLAEQTADQSALSPLEESETET